MVALSTEIQNTEGTVGKIPAGERSISTCVKMLKAWAGGSTQVDINLKFRKEVRAGYRDLR